MKRAKRLDDFTIDSGSLYLYGHDHEERSYACANFVKTKQVDIIVLELDYVDKDKMHIVGTNIPDIQLGSQKAITEFIQKWGYKRVYIDVTGMNVRIAAALLLRIERTDIEVHIIYAEPYKYHTEQFHKEGNDHEWAGIIDGIMPLPGFANFADPNEEFLFCVFLGFEGGRFTHLLKEMQPMEELIIPVFGIPGFRIEYPYNAYWSNRKGLKDSDSSANVKYASANSIVDAYMLLNRIKKENDTHKMLIAPIGTTPHTIAAIAFAIKYFNDVEIVYDNPKKIESRSEGIGLILDCNMSKLLKENP